MQIHFKQKTLRKNKMCASGFLKGSKKSLQGGQDGTTVDSKLELCQTDKTNRPTDNKFGKMGNQLFSLKKHKIRLLFFFNFIYF